MKFDVIISNPPYQLETGGAGKQAKPIYQLFVQQAKKLQPRFLSMIIPARWFAGGMGLDRFREEMLKDDRITHIVDYPIASDVFPGVKVIGGICYFLWERDARGPCRVTTHMNGTEETMVRPLNQFDTFVRFNKAVGILQKIQAKGYPSLKDQVSIIMPFGLPTTVKPTGKGNVTLYAFRAIGKIPESEIPVGREILNSWKVLISRAYGEGGEARDYPRMILGKPIVAAPPSACTFTYLVVGTYESETEAQNLATYLRTRFLRFLVGLRKNTQDVTRDRFAFVPALPMTEVWTDERLYAHFGLSEEEIAFIESMVRPMEEDNGEATEEEVE